MTGGTSLSAILDAAERSGRLNLSMQEVRAAMPGVSTAALRQALHRQQQRGRLVRLSRGSGHWVIVPLQYAATGAPPPETWLDHYLSRTLGIPYYVTLLSAAETYGASPHAVMVTQVMVPERRRSLIVGRHQVIFHTRTGIERMPVRWHETPDGRIKVATPELTALELVERESVVGGIARVQDVLRGLWRSCKPGGLWKALEALQEVPTAQRLGALLTVDNETALASRVARWLRDRPTRLIALQSGWATVASDAVNPVFRVRLPRETGRAST